MTDLLDRTSVVIATRDRRDTLLRTLGRLAALRKRPPVIVVDNGSTDGTPEAVLQAHPDMRLIELDENWGAAARNSGVIAATTPYVAFNDDDSWWAPGSLDLAERVLDADPTLALLAASVLVGPENRLDPTCRKMAESPLVPPPGLPGPSVLGFVACGAVVRRSAFLEVGGFEERMGIGGEEELLSVELAAAGYRLAYVDDLIAHHHPEAPREKGRTRSVVRNQLLVAWLKRPLSSALRKTGRLLFNHRRDREAALGAVDALRATPWIARERRPVEPWLERALRILDRDRRGR